MKVLEPSPPPARGSRDGGGRGRGRDGGRGGRGGFGGGRRFEGEATLNVVKAVMIVHVVASMTNHVANVLHWW